jgi:hypothetical protein
MKTNPDTPSGPKAVDLSAGDTPGRIHCNLDGDVIRSTREDEA